MICFIAYKDYKKQKDELKKELDVVEVTGILLMTIPAVLFVVIFPFLGVMFPSVLCEFALLLAITAFVGAYIEDKMRKKKK